MSALELLGSAVAEEIRNAVRQVVREEISTLLDRLDRSERATLPEYLSTEQVAELTGIASNTLRRWRSDEDPTGPPYLRMGRAVRYRKSDIDAWARANGTAS